MTRLASSVASILLALLLAGCGDDGRATDDDDADGSTGPGSGGSGPGSGGGGPGSGGAGAAGGAPGACNLVCGKPASAIATAGMASFAPPGCGGGTFSRSFLLDLLGIDAAKTVPMLADLDADGAADLAINARKMPSATVYPGTGIGTFGAPVTLPAGGVFAGGWGLDLGDFDGDGDLDLATGDHTSGGLAWKNGGALSFTLSNAGMPAELRSGGGLADVDGDGALDAFLGADQFSSGITLVTGDGNGGWTPSAASLGTGAKNVGHFAFADFDADGDLDVFAFGQETGGITAFVYENAAGAFTERARLKGGTGNTLGNPVQGAIGDIDCDGAFDVAAGGTIYRAAGGNWTAAFTADDAQISHLADMNGDGALDLVTHSPAGGLRAYLNDGTGGGWQLADLGLPDGAYAAPEVGIPFDTTYGIDVADVDNDGSLDIVRVANAFVSDGGFGGTDHNLIEVWTRR